MTVRPLQTRETANSLTLYWRAFAAAALGLSQLGTGGQGTLSQITVCGVRRKHSGGSMP